MKIALCFTISYDHILNKEVLWREWIEPNKDIINVYFYYKDITKIKSPWILEHALPPNCIHETSYYHVIPAYLSLMQYALKYDNQWMCFLTDSCCPIISPRKFRALFYSCWNKSIMSWKPAWWNINVHKRANLALLPEDLRLANDPWFVLKRENVEQILHFSKKQISVVKTICDGGLANESLFAIIMHGYKQLRSEEVQVNSIIKPFLYLAQWSLPMHNFISRKQTIPSVINSITHLADWSRMDSATSPHTFKEGNTRDIQFIEENLEKNKCAMFIRKIAREFPDEILKKYIQKKDDHIIFIEPLIFIYRRWILRICSGLFIFFLLYGLKYFLL
jgi:hypothetical protein